MRGRNNPAAVRILIVCAAVGGAWLWALAPAAVAAEESAKATAAPQASAPTKLLDPEALQQLGYKQLWSSPLKPVGMPQLLGRTLYVQTKRGMGGGATLYALDAQSGRALWAYRLDAPLDFPLAADQETICAVAANKLHLIEISTGTSRWKKDLPLALSSPPALGASDVWLASWDGNLYCIARQTAHISRRIAVGSTVTATPVVLGRHVIVCGEDGVIRGIQPSRKKDSWEMDSGGPITAAPASDSKSVFVGTTSFRVFAIDGESGTLLWRATLQGPLERPLFLLPEGPLLVCSSRERLTALKPQDRSELWNVPNGLGPVATAEDRVIVEVDREGLAAVDIEDGTVLWKHPAQDIRAFVPNGATPVLYVLPTSGGLAALGPAR